MQACQYLGHAFEIAAQPPEPGQPAKAALYDPAPRQQHKSFLRFRQLHNLQFNTVLCCIALCLLTRIALVCPGQLDRIARGLLHLLA